MILSGVLLGPSPLAHEVYEKVVGDFGRRAVVLHGASNE